MVILLRKDLKPMEMTIEHVPSTRIAYLRHTGPYGAANKDTMERLKAWAKDAQLLSDDSVIFGIAQDNPEQTAPENCRYDACLAVDTGFHTQDSPILFGNLTGGSYAVFTVAHTAQAIQNAWNDIFSELQRRSLIADFTKPVIERYAVKMINNHKCEICVPLSGPL